MNNPLSLPITLQFHEPYRLIEWCKKEKRHANPRALRGQAFAQWGKINHGTQSTAFITGTLLRSATLRAAEELISLNPSQWKCCDGEYTAREGHRKPDFPRKRSTLKWDSKESLCSASSPCSLCLLLGRYKQDREEKPVLFSNLQLEGLLLYFDEITELAGERTLNRVDPYTGKAHDYFNIWEVVDSRFRTFQGTITVNDARAEKLLRDSLSFVDKLCGALCTITVGEEAHSHPVAPIPQQQEKKPEIERMAEEKANVIAKAFRDQDKDAKLRSLADAVRMMRLESRDILNRLPRGRDDNSHHLWGIKIDGAELQEYLKSICEKQDQSQWRHFCEELGQALYKEVKIHEGAIPERIRVLGESEYYSQQNQRDYFIQVEPPAANAVNEFIVLGRLRAKTPFYFGLEAENGEQTSLRILLTNDNRYRIPRSVLRGVLRRDLRTAFDGSGCAVVLGGDAPCVCEVCRVMRNITILDTCSEYKEAPEIRQRIRMHPFTATVDEGALFDMEVGPEGIFFPFVLRYRGEELPDELQSVLQYWHDGRAFFGGSGSTGKGRFILEDPSAFSWKLSGEGIISYLNNHGFRGNEENKLRHGTLPQGVTKIGRKEDLAPYTEYLNPQWIKLEYKAHFSSLLLSSDPLAALLHSQNQDAIMFKKRIVSDQAQTPEEMIALKGETFRGIVRTAMGKRANDLDKAHEDCTCSVCTIFGSEHEAGKTRFEDLTPIGDYQEKHIDHVAIDRFLGGARDKMKFNTLPLAGSPKKPLIFKGCFWMHGDLSADHRKKLSVAFADIANGLFAVGAKGGVGYGWISKLEIERAPEDFKKAFDEEIAKRTEAEQTNRISPTSRTHPKLDIKQGAVYYPHYFLDPKKPDANVSLPDFLKRKSDVIGHENWSPKLLSGKITCRIETLTPLIIPDTGNDDAFGLKQQTLRDDNTYHKSFRFFRINDEVMIPGSEIRGPISSVYEAMTNSCFRILDESPYLSWRMKADEFAERRAKKDKWKIIRQGFKPGIIKDDGNIAPAKSYRLPLYDDVDKTKAITYGPDEKKASKWNEHIADAACKNVAFLMDPSIDEAKRKKILSGEEKVGFEIYQSQQVGGGGAMDEICILTNDPNTKKGFIKFTGLNNANTENNDDIDENDFDSKWSRWNLNILLNSPEQQRPSIKGRMYPRPNLSFTKDYIDYSISKRCERIFEILPNRDAYEIPDHLRKAYAWTIEMYRENTKRLNENFKTFFPHDADLKKGDLIYYRLDKQGKQVDAIIPVCISRTWAKERLGKKFDKEVGDNFRPCEREWIEDFPLPDELANEPVRKLFLRHPDGYCPSCRLFGTTYYRGRVRFGIAHLTGGPGGFRGNQNGGVTLPLLEQPRPTWSMPNNSVQIPGRKFYLHHNGWEKVANKTDEKITVNNRTVEVLDKGNEFEFEIFFENLEQEELGMLLYTLELEKGMAHKIGMGKPLGFGSAAIYVTRLETFSCTDNDQFEWKSVDRETIEESATKARTAIEKAYREQFKQLCNILSVPVQPVDVRYPHLEKRKDASATDESSYKELKDERNLLVNDRIAFLKKPWGEKGWNSWIAQKKIEADKSG